MLKKFILIGSLVILLMPLSSYAMSIEDRLAIQSVIVVEATVAGVDPGMAIFLAAVESDFNPTARSKTSTASGIFQWIRGSWNGICVKGLKIADEHSDVFDPVLNIRCAMQTIAAGGISHWTADRNTRRKLFRAGFITEYGQLAYGN